MHFTYIYIHTYACIFIFLHCLSLFFILLYLYLLPFHTFFCTSLYFLPFIPLIYTLILVYCELKSVLFMYADKIANSEPLTIQHQQYYQQWYYIINGIIWSTLNKNGC